MGSAITFGADYPGTKFRLQARIAVPGHHAVRRALRTRLHIRRHGTEAVAPLIGSNGLPFKATRERQPLPNRPLRIVRQERTTVTAWPRHRRC